MARPRATRRKAADDEDDVGMIIAALDEVTRTLYATNEQLSQLAEQLAAQPAVATAAVGADAQVNIFEDDPYSEAVSSPAPSPAAVVAVPVPVNVNPRLRIAVVEPRPPARRYSPGTAGFRYWLAAEALARGIGFWSNLLPSGTTWSTSNPMRVQLLEPGADLNARYARANGLHFYRETVLGREIYSGESPDVICHELGHAILDALKPQLFHVASTEAGAFHESFGDMSAILCALQLPSVRAKVLEETEGRLNVNSRLSRLAEQLGWGIRQLSPTIVDRDSLRNAANRFFYRPPDLLPPSAPANLLSKEVHSFSRVFTGAFLDALARMFSATGAPHEANLSAVSRDMGQLIVDGVHAATVAPAYFAQVAAAMVQADRARFGGKYRSSLTRSFMERGILSVDSAMALENEPVPSVVGAQAAGMSATSEGASTVLAYEGMQDDDAYALGLGATPDLPRMAVTIGALTVEVHAPEGVPLFAEAKASAAVGSSNPIGSDAASRIFLEGLIQRGEVDLSSARGIASARAITASLPDRASARPSKFTHFFAPGDGTPVLKRSHFNCGFCSVGTDSASWLCA